VFWLILILSINTNTSGWLQLKRFISTAVCQFCSHLMYKVITVLRNSDKLWINVCYHNFQHFRNLLRHKIAAINNFSTSLQFVSASIQANIDGFCCSPAQLPDVNKTININCNTGLSSRMLAKSLTILAYFDVFLTVHHSINLFLFTNLMHNFFIL
jgi:hypothetical protein